MITRLELYSLNTIYAVVTLLFWSHTISGVLKMFLPDEFVEKTMTLLWGLLWLSLWITTRRQMKDYNTQEKKPTQKTITKTFDENWRN